MKKIAFVAALAGLAGCAEQNALNPAIAKDVGVRVSSSVRYLSACPSRYSQVTAIARPIDKPAPPKKAETVEGRSGGAVKSVVANLAVDFAVELVSETLKELESNRNGYFYAPGVYGRAEQLSAGGSALDEENGCIVVYRAGVGPGGNQGTVGELSASARRALGMTGAPAFYAEFMVRDHGNSRTLTLEHLIYGQTSARIGSEKTVTLSLALGLTATPEQSDKLPKGAKAVYRFNLGRLKTGQYYGADKGVIAAGPVVKSTTNMVAIVNESAKPSVAIKALNTAFTKNKGDLAAALNKAVE